MEHSRSRSELWGRMDPTSPRCSRRRRVAAEIEAGPVHWPDCGKRVRVAGRPCGVVPMIAGLDEDAVPIGIGHIRLRERRPGAECLENRFLGALAHVPGPVTSADADIPMRCDVIVEERLHHRAVANGCGLRENAETLIVVVDAGSADDGQVGGIGDEFQSVAQHELGRETDTQRVVLNVVGEFERVWRIGRRADIVACDLRAAMGLHLLAEEVIADEHAEFGPGRF